MSFPLRQHHDLTVIAPLDHDLQITTLSWPCSLQNKVPTSTIWGYPCVSQPKDIVNSWQSPELQSESLAWSSGLFWSLSIVESLIMMNPILLRCPRPKSQTSSKNDASNLGPISYQKEALKGRADLSALLLVHCQHLLDRWHNFVSQYHYSYASFSQ